MYQVILDPITGQRVSTQFRYFFDALAFAKSAIKEPEFKAVRVFDETGHIVAQAYKSEGGELRP